MCLTERRMYIRHFAVKDKARFEEAFKLTVDFIWNTFDCDTIRLDLYHFNKIINGKEELSADAEIKSIVAMNRKGFKWKAVQNDVTAGIRFQIMQMMRPADVPKKQLSLSDEPLSILASHLYILNQEESYIDESFDNPSSSLTSKRTVPDALCQFEFPSCFYASLRLLKLQKQIDSLYKLNPSNLLASQIDNFNEETPGIFSTRAAVSSSA